MALHRVKGAHGPDLFGVSDGSFSAIFFFCPLSPGLSTVRAERVAGPGQRHQVVSVLTAISDGHSGLVSRLFERFQFARNRLFSSRPH